MVAAMHEVNIPPRRGFGIAASPGFCGFLQRENISLAVSTYRCGKLLLIGRRGDRPAVFARDFERCMGVGVDGTSLWAASAYQLWRLEKMTTAPDGGDGCDALYVPRVGYTTGAVNIHDVRVDAAGRAVFACTLFNCLATTSDRYNFEPLWRPPFISSLTAEDRCHLNGFAMRDGGPRYATACSQTDWVDGWRACRRGGGCVLDVESGKIVAAGFSMPHSPRWHRDRLWLLEAGTGWLGQVEPATGRFQHAAFCPGYARGLAFAGRHAIVGVSKPRREKAFQGLPLEENLRRHRTTAQCGIVILDIETGRLIEWMWFHGPVHELYDIAVLPGVRRPQAAGLGTDAIRYCAWAEDAGDVKMWSASETN